MQYSNLSNSWSFNNSVEVSQIIIFYAAFTFQGLTLRPTLLLYTFLIIIAHSVAVTIIAWDKILILTSVYRYTIFGEGTYKPLLLLKTKYTTHWDASAFLAYLMFWSEGNCFRNTWITWIAIGISFAVASWKSITPFMINAIIYATFNVNTSNKHPTLPEALTVDTNVLTITIFVMVTVTVWKCRLCYILFVDRLL